MSLELPKHLLLGEEYTDLSALRHKYAQAGGGKVLSDDGEDYEGEVKEISLVGGKEDFFGVPYDVCKEFTDKIKVS